MYYFNIWPGFMATFWQVNKYSVLLLLIVSCNKSKWTSCLKYLTIFGQIIYSLLHIKSFVVETESRYHVTFGNRKQVVTTEKGAILTTLSEEFRLDRSYIKLQIFDDDWCDWIDIPPEDLPAKARIRIIYEPDVVDRPQSRSESDVATLPRPDSPQASGSKTEGVAVKTAKSGYLWFSDTIRSDSSLYSCLLGGFYIKNIYNFLWFLIHRTYVKKLNI